MRKQRLNDDERRQWILNDEGLYDWQRGSGLSVREFIKQNRAAIDAAILPVLEGTKPAHHLKYNKPNYKAWIANL